MAFERSLSHFQFHELTHELNDYDEPTAQRLSQFGIARGQVRMAQAAWHKAADQLPLTLYKPGALRGFGAVLVVGNVQPNKERYGAMPDLGNQNKLILVQQVDGRIELLQSPHDLDHTNKTALHHFLLSQPESVSPNSNLGRLLSLAQLSYTLNHQAENYITQHGQDLIDQIKKNDKKVGFSAEGLYRAVRYTENHRMMTAFNGFAAYLDPVVCKVLSELELTNIADYNYLSGGPNPAYRHQIATSYPTLLKIFSGTDTSFDGNNSSLVTAVDQGQPIAEALRAYIGQAYGLKITPRMLDQARSGIGKTMVERGTDLLGIFTALSAIAPEHLPNPDDFESHNNFYVIDEVYKLARDVTGADPVSALKEIKGNYKKWLPLTYKFIGPQGRVRDSMEAFGKRFIAPVLADELQKSGIAPTPEIMAASFQLGKSWQKSADALRRAFGLPTDVPVALSDAFALVPFARARTYDIMEYAMGWHNRINGIEHKLMSEDLVDKDISWPALIEPIDLSNGIRVEAVTSAQELAELGSENFLNNCIGAYAAKCADGTNHILKFMQSGKVVSAAWLQYSPYKDHQHGGKIIRSLPFDAHESANQAVPSPELAHAFDVIKAGLQKDYVPGNWEEVDEFIAGYRQRNQQAQLEQMFGGDVLDVKRADHALESYQPLLPVPALDYAEFVETAGIRRHIRRFLKLEDLQPKPAQECWRQFGDAPKAP